MPICVTRFADAGRSCSGDADCVGRCIIDYEQLDGRPVGAAATGQCQADDAPFGCFAEVIDGKITQPVCID